MLAIFHSSHQFGARRLRPRIQSVPGCDLTLHSSGLRVKVVASRGESVYLTPNERNCRPPPLIGPIDRIIKAAALSPFVSQTLATLDVKRSRADLGALADLIDAGRLKPVIDCTYALEEVAEAVRYVEQGHARGRVLVSIDGQRS